MGLYASPAALHALFAAVIELQAMLDDLTDLRDHHAQHSFDVGVAELIDPSAAHADQLMVMPNAVQRVPGGTVQKGSLAQDANVHEQSQRAVDGGPPQFRHPCHDLLGSEWTGPAAENCSKLPAREGHAIAVSPQGRKDVQLGL